MTDDESDTEYNDKIEEFIIEGEDEGDYFRSVRLTELNDGNETKEYINIRYGSLQYVSVVGENKEILHKNTTGSVSIGPPEFILETARALYRLSKKINIDQEENIGKGHVVRDWVSNLSWKQQTVLLSAIRGCDGVSKHDTSKKFVRSMRAIVLKDAEPNEESNTFMGHLPDNTDIEEFTYSLDNYPMHWVVHFLYAVEIVGYKHPDEIIRQEWNELYAKMVNEGFHLRMESPEDMDKRLSP